MQLKQTSTPTEFANHLQEMGDVFWWEKGNFWVVTDYAHAKEVLLSDDFSCDRSPFFISRMPEMNLSLIQDFFHVVSNMMVMSDKPQHTARRRVCYEGFGQHSIERLIPLIKKTIDKSLTTLRETGEIEFVERIAQVIPSTTLAEFFAIPESERMDFYHWSNNMTQFFGGSTTYFDEDGIKVNESAKALREYFTDLCLQRRKKPSDDFLSLLLANQKHFALSDDEIISQAIMMLVAGQVTTTDQLCNNLYTLLENPQLKSQLVNNPQLLEQVIEECNRLDPAVTFIFRVTKRDTMIGNQSIKAGDVIFISAHAVNRDQRVFVNADNIDVAKHKARHISYGYGGHFCLGAKLARIEIQLCFSALLHAFPNVALDQSKQCVRKHHSLSFSGFSTLPLTLHCKATAS